MKTRIKICLWFSGGIVFTYIYGLMLGWIASGGEPGDHPVAMASGYIGAGVVYGLLTLGWKYFPEDKPETSMYRSQRPRSLASRSSASQNADANLALGMVAGLAVNRELNNLANTIAPPPYNGS